MVGKYILITKLCVKICFSKTDNGCRHFMNTFMPPMNLYCIFGTGKVEIALDQLVKDWCKNFRKLYRVRRCDMGKLDKFF